MTERAANRIVVALDASSQAEAAIATAAALAAELQAEVEGLFVENADLLRLAGLPFAREVGYTLSAPRRLDRAVLERCLQAHADRLRRALAEAANRESVHWSFQVTRGSVIARTLAAAATADVVILSFERGSPRPSKALPAKAPPRARHPNVVVYDGSASGARALDMAARLAKGNGGGLVVVCAPGVGQGEQLRQRAVQRLHELRSKGSIYHCSIGDEEALVAAVRQLHGRLLVLNRDSSLLKEPSLMRLVGELDCPLILVR